LKEAPLYRSRWFVSVALAAVVLFAACGSDSKSPTNAAGSGGSSASKAPVTVHLGYFPNITHAPAIVGVEKGFFQQRLGANTLQTSTFNAGGDAANALLSGAIDATFVGANPAINAYQKSHGDAIRIVAGSTSGGAALVVNPSINSPADLKGKKIATPQLGNTQDVALRAFLKSQNLTADTSGGGDVSIIPQANADSLTQFEQGQIDGAWVPEPFVSRMVQEGNGKVLVDEKTLWPNGQFVTTQLMVATQFLKDHPDVVKELIEGEDDAIKFLSDSPADAQKVVNDGIAKIAGKPLKDSVVASAFQNMTFTLDPLPAALQKSANDAKDVGLLDSTDIANIYDLSLVNEVLQADNKPAVKGL
jgi:NitT/TauT family transport system substrate-binding protein